MYNIIFVANNSLMKDVILVVGSSGQIGTELVIELQNIYGHDNVIASDIRSPKKKELQFSRFEKLDVLGMDMPEEKFPCMRVEFPEPCKDPRGLIQSWLEKRDSQTWSLISGSSLASETHAWVAFDVLMRNNERGSMRSNSIDGEFMRLISGTHHISASFSRAGIIEGENFAYIVDLSCTATEQDFENHAERMGFEILAERPNLSIFNALRIGIENGDDENAAIGHVHLSDMR